MDYIEKRLSKTSLNIRENKVDLLKTYRPKGCPFKGYNLFDLLMDMFNMYSYMLDYGKTNIVDFIEILKDRDIKMKTYGNDIQELMLQ